MKTRIGREGPVTLDTYYEEFSFEYIMDNVAGAFTRGLPGKSELRRL